MSTTLNAIKAERIKLTSVKSPWWSLAIVVVLGLGFAAMVAAGTRSLANNPGSVTYPDGTTVQAEPESMSISDALGGVSGFGTMVLMILAVLAVTSEYRFGTIRTTFQAVPNRTAALLAKATVVAVLALLIGELTAFTSWGVSLLLAPEADLALDSAADVINVAGVGIIYALSAVIAVAVGALVRHSAGAISLLLIYVFAAEGLIMVIPEIGDDIYKWLPFNVAHKFLTGDGESSGGDSLAAETLSTSPLSPGWALAYFAAFAVALLFAAITVANKRDA